MTAIARAVMTHTGLATAIVLLCATLAVQTQGQTALERSWPSEGPPRPLAAHPVKFPPYEIRTLANGLQVVLVSHHEQPVVSVRMLVRAGAARDPKGKLGLAMLTATLLDQGAGARNAQQIADTIDFAGGILSTGAGSDLSSVSAIVMKNPETARYPSSCRPRATPVRAGAGRLSTSTNVVNGQRVAGGQACLVYMTSHGDERGFYLRPDHRLLSPATLDQALTEGCGSVPTVLIVSACHSGTFINAATRKPNRIILAAAATERTSFGCGADDDYTYYDQCFLQQLDSASTWAGLAQATRACVETLERRLGVRQPSRVPLESEMPGTEILGAGREDREGD